MISRAEGLFLSAQQLLERLQVRCRAGPHRFAYRVHFDRFTQLVEVGDLLQCDRRGPRALVRYCDDQALSLELQERRA